MTRDRKRKLFFYFKILNLQKKFLLKNSWNQRFNFSYQKITSDTNSLTTWEIIFRNIPMTRKKRSLKNSGTKNYYHTKNPGIRTKTDFEQCQKKTTPPWSNLTFENSGFWTNKWMTKTLTLASIGVFFQPTIPASSRKRRNEEVILIEKILILMFYVRRWLIIIRTNKYLVFQTNISLVRIAWLQLL